MKNQMLLLQHVLEDMGTWCGVSTSNDYKIIAARVEDEGMSFLTKTFPQFGSDLIKAVDRDFIEARPDHLYTHIREHVEKEMADVNVPFEGYARHRVGPNEVARYPHLMSGFFEQIFDIDGDLLIDANPNAIYAIRQVSLMFSKIELPFTPEMERSAMEKFIECEKDVMEGFLDYEMSLRNLSLLLRGSETFFTVSYSPTLTSRSMKGSLYRTTGPVRQLTNFTVTQSGIKLSGPRD
jgi:hypothetical protein